ncbi:HEAT repeat domain-containing protein [Paludisphaera rhizosphaerae]|uniref:HEAT repeat domain-containing protein n=1 Tax=Paludisphaera rhizosphaerae TaxID=2711216 RepID=UPI0013EB623E|nr:HEAT repeat domain-containing protein [Paludisphaera rhizosphaerae]
MFRRHVLSAIQIAVTLALGPIVVRGETPIREAPAIAVGESWTRSLGDVQAGRRYEMTVSIAAPADGDRLRVELIGPAGVTFRKDLHAGDPDVYLPFRPTRDGSASLRLTRADGPSKTPLPVEVSWRSDEVDDAAFEAEPNDDWRSANPLVLGRSVYGSADDVDFLENSQEGKAGLDWFRFEVSTEKPILTTFTLDLVDRDVSADLAVFTLEDSRLTPYTSGKDPMEIIHDRERVRYSKNLVRRFTKGVYYLRVNANHPAYVLRSKTSDLPPFDDPGKAVEAGLRYILNAGDAWLSQVPREGNRFVRSANLHETSLRCTGCHATSFPAEAALAALRSGYEIEDRAALQAMIDRIADGPAPLYGDAELCWQRYIATPLEAQGAQGTVLLDFDREVAGTETRALERFGPFLREAWGSRTALPEDEHNVVPTESKFGLAWKGWWVLSELARRTGRDEYAKAAQNIAAVLNSRAADRKVESLQDRIHRLVAWSLIDGAANANKIRRETGALLALQNADGGWHESDARPGPSAVYITGQMVDALLEAGLRPDHPSVARALKYLLAEQKDFGGWFQDGTNENFRTPMRETRYAVMALARAFPRAREARPSIRLRTDSRSHTLDDLESTWDTPADERKGLADAVIPLLRHDSPLVRASAASCLGRLEPKEAVEPLAAALGDPSKVVRRAAGSALRRLGNRGIGVAAIGAALDDSDPRVRRSATSLLTFQTYGVDEARELAEHLIRRMSDSDYLTRFDAARALRRWFYRTPETALRKQIVQAFLARMGAETDPLQRRNLSENLYIILDENLGGGVSLQRNLEALPESLRATALEARKLVERDALLGPILAVLRDGDALQRDGVLQAFDGSFFQGRTYARQPENAVDVGNDREFGFLYQVPASDIETAFDPLLTSPLTPPNRLRALQLASFFKLPAMTRVPTIQATFLRALDDADSDVRAIARRIVREELSLDGVELDAERVREIADLVDRSTHARSPLIAAIGRNPGLAGRPEITSALAQVVKNAEGSPDLLPVLDHLGLTPPEIFTAIERGWPRFSPTNKSDALRTALRVSTSPTGDATKALLALLRKASADPSEAVRELAYDALIDEVSRTTSEAAPAILTALADESPRLRRLGLAATARRASFWDRADAMERLARLLMDPDSAVRLDALDVVKHNRLLVRFPVLSHRVKALADDPALAGRVDAMLRASDFDPETISADAQLDRPVFLDLDIFRKNINPLFSKPGPDGHSCVDCHVSHTILRLAEPRDGGPSDADVLLNFTSASKVVDLVHPESSLLLRKPLSPHSKDETARPDANHVGGRRWEGVDDPAYRAVLSWIRRSAASTVPAPRPEPEEVIDLAPIVP